MFVYIILSALIFFLLPSVAHAWGPGTHIEIALSLLEKIALFAPAVRAAVAGREDWFIYGSVAADIVVGKKYAGIHNHCHNWNEGQKILHAAKTDRERAAAYGYLAHLAADIVAHNYYIPYKIMKSYKARLLSHTYWEMRFDMHVRQEVWTRMKKVLAQDLSSFDKLLEDVLKRALFSFRTSKRIFSGILALQRFKQFRGTFGLHAKKSRFRLDLEDVSHYRRLALKFAEEYLKDPSHARALAFDPTGVDKIKYARAIRRRLRSSGRDSERILAGTKELLYNELCSLSSPRK